MADLTSRWVDTLTAAQRAAWDNYGLQVPVTDKLGQSINLSGLNHYVRSNVQRVVSAIGRIDDAPTIFDLGSYTAPAITSCTASTGVILVAFDNTDDWAGESGSYMFLYASRGQSPSVNFFKGPYRFVEPIIGAGTPPTSPNSMIGPFPFDVGQKVYVKAVVSRADGRLSSPFRTVDVAV